MRNRFELLGFLIDAPPRIVDPPSLKLHFSVLKIFLPAFQGPSVVRSINTSLHARKDPIHGPTKEFFYCSFLRVEARNWAEAIFQDSTWAYVQGTAMKPPKRSKILSGNRATQTKHMSITAAVELTSTLSASRFELRTTITGIDPIA